ncbi:MAG: hypothetical protein RL385_718 [Pseudomonadota bacterium]|jgi:predicted transcriptional regulator
MNVRLLIDAIVRQTTVLLAQLSTAAGMRAPLAHVVDQVFLDLAREIEAQGVGRKVVADMFGLALRGYQKKMQRLSESETAREHTLWEAALAFITAEAPCTRKRVLERFRRDDEAQAIAVLNDLVQSGLVAAEGRGDDASYRPTTPGDRARLAQHVQAEARRSLVWLHLYRAPATVAELARELGASEAEAAEAVAQLAADGVVTCDEEGTWRAPRLLIPVGSELGWEAAVFDHFRAMAAAIGAKVSRPRSLPKDRVGGATLSFDLHPQHPHRERVLALLHDTRREVNRLWDEVSAYNREHPVCDAERVKVYFYFGQYVEDEARLSEATNAGPQV